MKKVVVFSVISVFVISAFLIGCGGIISGSGSVSSKDFSFSGFTKIEAHSGFQLEVDRADTFSVEITADDNVFKYVEVSVSSGKLLIRMEPGRLYNNLTLRARITMPSLTELNLSGGSQATLDGFVSSNDFLGNLSGGSRLSGNLVAADLSIDLSGGSQVDLSGSADSLNANSSGGSQINLESFLVDNADINVSGGGRATVKVGGTLDANLSGGSQLYYVGNPTLGDINVSGGSAIHKQ